MNLSGWHIHWLVVYFALSIILGFGFKGVFKVEIEIKPRTYVRGILPCMLRMSDSVGTLFIYGLTSADLRRYD